ncbi:hypothetical protein D5273_06885 [Enterorhabdus caecimuris]|nr:hypothetical protein [Adlercreutzia caecimuris]
MLRHEQERLPQRSASADGRASVEITFDTRDICQRTASQETSAGCGIECELRTEGASDSHDLGKAEDLGHVGQTQFRAGSEDAMIDAEKRAARIGTARGMNSAAGWLRSVPEARQHMMGHREKRRAFAEIGETGRAHATALKHAVIGCSARFGSSAGGKPPRKGRRAIQDESHESSFPGGGETR